jgi:hypothetical protein
MEKSNKPKLPKGKKPAFVDEEVKGRIINAIRLGLTVEDACTFAGVSRTTYYNWVELGENDPKYAAFLDDLCGQILVGTFFPASRQTAPSLALSVSRCSGAI